MTPSPLHVAARPARPRRRVPRLVLAPLMLLVAACGEGSRDAITTPAAPQAADIAWLWWVSLGLGTLVYVAVMVLLVVPLLRNRRRRRLGLAETDVEQGTPVAAGRRGPRAPGDIVDEPILTADPELADESRRDEGLRSQLLWWGGIILPAIILIFLLIASSRVGARTAHVAADDELVIDVTGHMFWWEVEYPELGIITANEIAVPTGQHVRLRLTTDDVIHSFWIPRLHGKIDMIPGTENWLSFTAEETGFFRGNCAEFCGIAHAQMVAYVEAMEPDDFDAWVAEQSAPPVGAEEAADTEGERLFLQVGCADCHAVTGTNAVGAVGPDLSHLASRQMLAGGIVPNTRENLAELIVDPWGLKPGNPMPPTELTEDELDALLDYLETLSADGAQRMEGDR
ncbi:cytochrome c oxidase subunit II [Nitriliruptoraceae bacterium ZYF776]|nr:cytochrome c oxidase subunit II [Profundirhabdus halotolerans]